MTQDRSNENHEDDAGNSRQVRLDAAQKSIVKALIFRAMRDGESLQDCLREAFERNGGGGTPETLISNGGIFDAARAAARRKARGR